MACFRTYLTFSQSIYSYYQSPLLGFTPPRFISVLNCFNYDDIYQNIMLRLFNSILKFSYAPRHKLVSLTHLTKKTAINSNQDDPTYKSIKPNHSRTSNPKMQMRDTIGFAEVQQAINAKSDDLSREELEINHLIKIQTKASNLYYLHKQRRITMSTKNLVNLLIKVLELRRINQNESDQTQKFDKMMQSISSKLIKFTPEDMIRFLFSLKSVRMLAKDIQRINPFIMAILQEFSQRNRVTNHGKDQIYNSFEVISIDSNLKLLHSLCHLHMISGREFEPIIDNLIKMIVTYFHSLVQQFMRKTDPKLPIRRMKGNFYFGLIKIAGKYGMSVDVITDLVKMATSLAKFPTHKPALYLQLAKDLRKMPSIVKAFQQSNIKDHSQLLSIYTTILNQLQKPELVLKLSSNHLLKYIQSIDSFTQEQLQKLKFKQLKQMTLQRILAFTLKIYEKYWNRDYLTLFEKSTIESWVYNAAKQDRQFLSSILITYNQYILERKVTCVNEFNKLMHLCIESFSQQSFCTKAAVVYVALERQSKNIKNIVEMFLTMEGSESKDKKEFKQVKYFKKHQAIELYISLFNYWARLAQISRFTFDAYREGTFIKMLLRSVIYLENISGFAELIVKRIIVEPSFYEIFLKKYKRASEENRTLSKQNLVLVQEQEFKNDIENAKMLQNQRKDTQKLNPYFTLKYNLRQKIKRCLVMFKFAIEIYEHLNRVNKKWDNLLQAEQFKSILQCFDDDLRCLFFKELFTAEIFGLVGEICGYLQSRGGLRGDWKINEVWKWMKNENIEVTIQNGKGLLGEFGQRINGSNKIIGGIKGQEESQDKTIQDEFEIQEETQR